MIIIEPMPNELCNSHEGRIARVNGYKSSRELDYAIRDALSKNGLSPASLPKLIQLALVSNQDPVSYAKHHSMLPVLRLVAAPNAIFQHGSASSLTYSKLLGMTTQRKGVCCCHECIKEDIEFWRFSWHRRTHQLTGVDWCPVHGCVLSRIDDPNPYSRPPHIWQARGKLQPIDACLISLPEDGFIRRFVEISTANLDRSEPLPVNEINGKLSQKAKELNLRISKKGQRPLISDLVSELAPESWLKQHIGGWSEKAKHQFFPRLDVLASTIKLTGTGYIYALAMAALFETAEAALLEIASKSNLTNTAISEKKIVCRGSKFWNGEFWQHYLECNGSITELAKRLNINKSHLREVMTTSGLPSLHDVNNSAVWRAFFRFNAGMGIVESCALENIEIAELEKLLRKVSSRVNTAASKACTASTGINSRLVST